MKGNLLQLISIPVVADEVGGRSLAEPTSGSLQGTSLDSSTNGCMLASHKFTLFVIKGTTEASIISISFKEKFMITINYGGFIPAFLFLPVPVREYRLIHQLGVKNFGVTQQSECWRIYRKRPQTESHRKANEYR
jgi:hypothetical protein